MLNNYICALDIGSTKVAAAVVELKGRRIVRLISDTLPIKSVKNGVIADSLDLISATSTILKNLKSKSGINIKFVYTNVSGQNIITKHSHAIIPLAERGNKVITSHDLDRVNEQARILGSSLEEEIIHHLPSSYTIDSKADISNPLGLYSHRLEVDLYLICAKSASTQSLASVINRAGYETNGVFFPGLVISKILLDKDNKNGIHIFCDVGGDITELLIFKDGILEHVEIMNTGGNDMTLRLQEILEVPFDLAEDVKRSYAFASDANHIDKDKEILVKKESVYKPIKHQLVSEVVTSKTNQMCLEIKKTIEKHVPCGQVNSFVAVGRTVLLEGFLETMENILGIPVKLGRISHPEIISWVNKDNNLSGLKYLTYVTTLGIISEVLEKQPQAATSIRHVRNPVIKTINKVKELYQEYF